jgi:hypothetical protein
LSLTFNEEEHVYRWQGRVVPSVTAVIAAAGCMGDLSFIDPWYMRRGTALHKATKLWDEGRLDEATVDPAIAPHLRAWREFVTMNRADLEILESEHPRYNATYGYAGTPDRIALWRGKLAVIDLKAGGKMPFHALQLSGYAGMIDDCEVRLAVHLGGDERWKLETYADRGDWQVFTSALALYQWKERNGLKPGKAANNGGRDN